MNPSLDRSCKIHYILCLWLVYAYGLVVMTSFTGVLQWITNGFQDTNANHDPLCKLVDNQEGMRLLLVREQSAPLVLTDIKIQNGASLSDAISRKMGRH